jgi:BirA family biotin operon repressor/biotin-[acetyl-CoA-carboxylase] ligase
VLIAERLGLPRLELYETVGSTMDVAHALGASGAAPGTLVVADEQTAGRGRKGNAWRSVRGAGIWLTLVERPIDSSGIDVLSLRVGLAAARALDAFAGGLVRVKWPNDLYVGDRKLAGVLVEARWRDGRPDWVCIGVGINLRSPPGVPNATGLPDARSRLEVLEYLVPAVRLASRRTGPLDRQELREYADRDLARGRRCVMPAAGIVDGVNAAGELAVRASGGEVVYYRAGSLVLEEDR